MINTDFKLTRKNFSHLLLLAVIFFIALALPKHAHAETAAVAAKKISALFVRSNPRLSKNNADLYARLAVAAAVRFKQNPYVVAALIVNESTVKYNAVSKGGDYGLMQIHWKAHSMTVAKRYGIKKPSGLFNPRINIYYGTEILANCNKRAKGNFDKTILYYSSGNKKLVTKVKRTMATIK